MYIIQFKTPISGVMTLPVWEEAYLSRPPEPLIGARTGPNASKNFDARAILTAKSYDTYMFVSPQVWPERDWSKDIREYVAPKVPEPRKDLGPVVHEQNLSCDLKLNTLRYTFYARVCRCSHTQVLCGCLNRGTYSKQSIIP